MKYQVRITAKAEQDVEHVLNWFDERRADVAAARWLVQFMARIATLETRPERCAVAAEAADVRVEVRELRFGRRHGTYRILFEISGNTVHILRVWHGARDAFSAADL